MNLSEDEKEEILHLMRVRTALIASMLAIHIVLAITYLF